MVKENGKIFGASEFVSTIRSVSVWRIECRVLSGEKTNTISGEIGTTPVAEWRVTR